MEAGHAAIEPVARDAGEVDGGRQFAEVDQNAHIAAAGLVDQLVEIVEGAYGGIDGLGMGGVELEAREKDGVAADGVNVVEMLGDPEKAAKAVGIDLVDGGVLPPDVGLGDEACPAGPASACERAVGETKQARQRARKTFDRVMGILVRCYRECFDGTNAASCLLPAVCRAAWEAFGYTAADRTGRVDCERCRRRCAFVSDW